MSRILAPILLLLSLSRCQHQAERQRTPILVLAASSLTEAFGEMERRFESAFPNVDVVTVFAGSQVLRLQLEQGANADVFASAHEAHIQALQKENLVLEPTTFAENDLVLIVPRENPAGIHSFQELTRAKRLVVGGRNVPVGRYTHEMLDRSASIWGDEFSQTVRKAIVSEENNVRLVRTKVELGEADAAVVYRTDAPPTAPLRVIAIPQRVNVQARYLMAVTAHTKVPLLAQRFVAYVRSAEGQKVLLTHGFLPPGAG